MEITFHFSIQNDILKIKKQLQYVITLQQKVSYTPSDFSGFWVNSLVNED
jgi:hypothetical protein